MKETFERQLYLFRFCMRRCRLHFIIHLIGSVKVEAFIFLEHLWWVGYNLSAVEEGMDFSRLAFSTALIFVLFFFHQMTDAIYNQWSSQKLKIILYQKLREEIYGKAHTMDLSCYDDPEFYQEFILSTTEADQCVDRFLEDIYTFFRYMTGVVMFGTYLSVGDRAGLLTAAAGFACIMLSGRLYYALQERLKVEKNEAQRRRAYSQRVFYLHEYAKELRLNGEVKELFLKDFHTCCSEVAQIHARYGRKLWLLNFAQNYISKDFMIYALYAPWILWRVMVEKTLPVAELVILFYAVKSLFGCCVELGRMYPKVRMNSVFIGRICRFLEYSPKMQDGTLSLQDGWESLTLSHVDFAYTEGGKRVLKDVSLEVKRGEKIALVGYNGAGKSTLIKLIMRLYDPVEGQILRNGQDIRTLKLGEYRAQIGAVFQDFKIYAASLRENVVMDLCTCGKKETYQVEKALYDARFTLQERRLKYQIDTPLTTEFEADGVNLSGGESQKAAIARTLYRRNDLIIMDEPSSALDPKAEYQLNRILHEMAEDKTVIFISHRLSTTKDADRIYMMEDGCIAEQGTHEELLVRNGKYAAMWRAQAERYAL